MRDHQLLAALGLVIVLSLFTQADAQNPYGNPYSSPNWLTRPTFSPWLELYRRGGIPDIPNYHQFVRPYHQFVRPRQEMQRYLLERDRQLQRQQLQLRQIERQQAAMQQTQAQMLAPQRPQNYRAPTGTGSSYMTHRSFFGTHERYFGIGR